MKLRNTQPEQVKAPVNHRMQVVQELLDHAELIRRKGSTEQGAEAAHLEAFLKSRLIELQSEAVPTQAKAA